MSPYEQAAEEAAVIEDVLGPCCLLVMVRNGPDNQNKLIPNPRCLIQAG